jgi:hypothetical protein
VDFDVMLDIFADAIAYDMVAGLFHQLFRGQETLRTLWRRFLLAQRLMRVACGAHPQSLPVLRDTSDHPLWEVFERGLRTPRGLLERTPQLFLGHYASINAKTLPYVSAMVVLLAGVPSLRDDVLRVLHEAMRGDVEKCREVARVLVPSSLGGIAWAAARPRSSRLQDWAGVLGAVLLVRTNRRELKQIDQLVTTGGDLMHLLEDPAVSEEAKVGVLSLVVNLKCSNLQQGLVLGYDRYSAVFFRAGGMFREWLAHGFHSLVLTGRAFDTAQLGERGAHGYAYLLTLDEDRFTRASAVFALADMITETNPNLSRTCFCAAIRNAFDGSQHVRLAFLALLRRFVNVSGSRSLNVDGFDGQLEWASYLGQPEGSELNCSLRAILGWLADDPVAEVRELATGLLGKREGGGSPRADHGVDETFYRALVQRCLLRRYLAVGGTGPERYDGSLFKGLAAGSVEALETRQLDEPISAVVFVDSGVCAAVADRVTWAGSHLVLEPRFGELRLLRLTQPNLLVAVFAFGFVQLIERSGCGVVDAFRCTETTNALFALAGQQLFVAESSQVLVWDLAQLRLVAVVPLPDPPTAIGVGLAPDQDQDQVWVVAGEGSVVLRVLPDEHATAPQGSLGVGVQVLDLWRKDESWFVHLANGELVRWDGAEARPFRNLGQRRVAFGPSGRAAISWGDDGATVLRLDGSGPDLPLPVSASVTACVWDPVKPLAAIGCSNGALVVWRLG